MIIYSSSTYLHENFCNIRSLFYHNQKKRRPTLYHNHLNGIISALITVKTELFLRGTALHSFFFQFVLDKIGVNRVHCGEKWGIVGEIVCISDKDYPEEFLAIKNRDPRAKLQRAI